MHIKNVTEGKVEIKGWVQEFRNLGGLIFIQLRDHTGTVQVTIVKSKVDANLFDNVKDLASESVITVKGTAQKSDKVKAGIEILPDNITVHSTSEPVLPIQIVEKGIPTDQSKRLDWRCLDLRKPRQQAIFRIQSAILEGAREYLLENEFIQVFTPCLMGIASESGSEVFPVVFFDKEAFLRQDPQLHRQLTIAGGFTKVFDIGPAWRAEQSHTSRHLCEHRVIAVELAFIENEQDTMRAEEEMVVNALKKVQEKCSAELETLGVTIKIPQTPFPEIKFPEVYDILAKRGKKVEVGEDLDGEAEKILWEYVQEEHGTEFYFLNGFPFKKKPFYVYSDGDYARSVDLYFKGMELSSGGQREHRYENLMQALKTKGMSPKPVEWFTQFFKFGVPTHGGFALGIERLTQQIAQVDNVRDCALFPRDPERLVP